MKALLYEINDICSRYRLTSLQRLIASVEKLASEKSIEIAVFGQFKAGKSSFINSFIGKQVLPTAVTPVTSVITRIYYGREKKAYIKFNDGRTVEIHLNEIDNYVTETQNPANSKDVSGAVIEIPELKHSKGLCFVDTPGIGSVFLNNTKITENWSQQATIAIICISAERPLSEFDLNLIRELKKYSYKIFCLLTKADLFSSEQLDEIMLFLQAALKRKIENNIEIYLYSVYNNTELYRKAIRENICNPLIERHDNNKEQTLKYILNELDTIEVLLSVKQSKSVEYETTAIELNRIINELITQ